MTFLRINLLQNDLELRIEKFARERVCSLSHSTDQQQTTLVSSLSLSAMYSLNHSDWNRMQCRRCRPLLSAQKTIISVLLSLSFPPFLLLSFVAALQIAHCIALLCESS